jgi:hypothetical protein
MKSTGKIKKQRTTDFGVDKRCCGTLDYMAECRGVSKKAGLPGWKGHVDVISRIERKNMTAG